MRLKTAFRVSYNPSVAIEYHVTKKNIWIHEFLGNSLLIFLIPEFFNSFTYEYENLI